MKLLFRQFLIICLILLAQLCLGQERGNMHVQNYFPKEFKGAPQSWDAVQSETGLLYFANTDGILEYDGTNWRNISVGNTSVNVLLKDETGKIFVGGNNQIGYLSAEHTEKMAYHSMNNLLDSADAIFSSVRWIYQLEDELIFITYNELFVYDRTKNQMHRVGAPSNFQGSFIIQGQLYIKDKKSGLLIWDGAKSLKKAPYSEIFLTIEFNIALPYGTNQAIIGTDNELYVYSPTAANETAALEVLRLEDDQILKKFQLYRMAYSPKKELVLGFSGAGVLIVDTTGKTQKHITKKDGLFSEYVLGTYYDNQHILWILTGSCISRAEAHDPITFWNANNGLHGVVIDVLRYQEKLYITTLSTAYRLEGNEVKQIPNRAFEQHWKMLHVQQEGKDVLLMGSETGVTEFDGHNRQSIIVSGRHAVSFHQSKKNPNRVYVGWVQGVSALTLKNGRWQNEGFIEELADNIRSIYEDADGNIWLGTFRQGLVKITPSTDWNKPKKINYYRLDEGLPSLKNAMVYPYQDSCVFITEKGFIKYDATTDRFSPDCRFGERFCRDGKEIYGFSETENGNVAVMGVATEKSGPGFIEFHDGVANWIADPFKKVPDMFAISIYHEANGVTWLCGSEGVFRYDGNMEKVYEAGYPTLVRKVMLGEDSVIYWGNGTASPLPLPYENNSLTFFYSVPDFESSEHKQYQHWLKGYEQSWSHWASDVKKEYTNLPEGDYEFQVRGKNIYDNQSPLASYAFTISPPWYRTIWAYLLYIIGAITATVLIVRLNAKRLHREKTRLSSLVSARTAELESQKEEIKTQAESLQKANSQINDQKDQLEKAYQSIRLLSELGQQLNSTFDTEKLLTYVHEYVGKFMDTTVFAVGTLERDGSLYYQLAVENGTRLKPFSRKLTEKNQFAVWCLKHKQPIIMHDVATEYQHYIEYYAPESSKTVSGKQLNSLIFYPLLIHEQALGVLTVQSHQAHAYSQAELDVLSNLASYVATSLNNANAYHIIEDKNEDITSSIHYAKTIQQAILPSKDVFEQSFEEFFIFYRPKDIVSGDFYWIAHIEPNEEKWRGEIKHPMTFVAVVDCTGHGVPGAFMSMIGNTLLNEIIIQNHIIDTNEILELLDKRVKEVLHQDENANDDGMEVGLCLVENLPDDTFNISFTGAKRSFYYWEQSTAELQEIEGSRRAIGGFFSNDRSFESFTITLSKGDAFYLLSDGLADQNRLGSTRKFGSKRVKAFLNKFSNQPMQAINAQLNKTYDVFSQGSDQRDDITVLGIRL